MSQNKNYQKTEVLYNAGCPVCSFEIDHYARISEKNDLPISFTDLNDDEALMAWNIDSGTAAKRLHIRKNGEIISGIPAFIALWRDMPRYRWLARIVSFPGIYPIAVCLYNYLLAPGLYQWHLRRNRTRKCV